ncbi:MAG TPA: DUF2157 domain-containing protein [Candidatus Acidoferrales bacterium]
MSERGQLEVQVQRWTAAGIIDAETALRIIAFEAGQQRRLSLRWPVFLAMAFGGILLAAGVTLFVAAHWDELSPLERFSLVLFLVGIFHLGGALLANRFPALSTTLHALGTVALGGAIFLTAQIFNLHQNWATGVLLWAVGAAAGLVLLKDWTQAAALAILTPAWLLGQWSIATEWRSGGDRPVEVGLILISLCYLSARVGDEASRLRRTLVWIGGMALLPCVGTAIAMAFADRYTFLQDQQPPVGTGLLVVCWVVALVGPLVLAWFLRGRSAWVNVIWALWASLLVLSAIHSESIGRNEHHRFLGATLALYALCAIGSVGLVAWGLNERRKERLNLGIAGFAISVLFFYFDSFMGKLGRSASLLVLGALCLAGGYALEVTRRKLVARMEKSR